MRAKKSLGQHFLTSERALDTIIRTADIAPGETVLEIGPGKGALTERLLAAGARIVAVEKDDELIGHLGTFFPDIELVHGDILDYEPQGEYKLVANIPYNITGAILEKFLSAEHQPSRCVLLVQKEVAERIARSEKESILSISVKAYGVPRFVETVKAGSFSPAPKVDSAILLIEDIAKDFFENFSEEEFFTMLRAGFKSKRKKLSSNLSTLFDKERVLQAFTTLGLDQNIRAEDLSADTWKRLAECVLN